jgi:hypothetical protein
MPATTKERNATISTRSATTSPTPSVIEIAGIDIENRSPPMTALDPFGSLLEVAHGRAQRVLRGGGHVRGLAVELQAHDRGRAVVAHHAGDVRVVGARRGEHAVDLPEIGDRLLDRIPVVAAVTCRRAPPRR